MNAKILLLSSAIIPATLAAALGSGSVSVKFERE